MRTASGIAAQCDNRNGKEGKKPDLQPLRLKTVGFVRGDVVRGE
jgi:hypothetical protein